MPRSARIVIAGVPYHVTQRGNRRQDVFYSDDHRRRYLAWLEHYAEIYNLQVIAYCLMNNHIHLVVIPHSSDALSKTLQIVHTRHSQSINKEFGWSGHLWQGRYYSTALDEPHVYAAVRYVEMNPVRAGLVAQAWNYTWSSAGYHVGLKHERLLTAKTFWLIPPQEWYTELVSQLDEETMLQLRTCTQTGFPCGDDAFVQKIADISGHMLVQKARGRPRKG